MIRAFVGLALPAHVVMRLEAVQAGLPAGREVDPDNFHITLAFLGEHPGPVIEDVHHALDDIRAPRFRLHLDGAGLFGGKAPTSFHARVAPDPGLVHLRSKVVQAARGAGLALKSERYTPHVTLARFGSGLRGEMAEEVRDFVATRASMTTEAFDVEEFILFRSRLGKSGASYEALASYPLG